MFPYDFMWHDRHATINLVAHPSYRRGLAIDMVSRRFLAHQHSMVVAADATLIETPTGYMMYIGRCVYEAVARIIQRKFTSSSTTRSPLSLDVFAVGIDDVVPVMLSVSLLFIPLSLHSTIRLRFSLD